MNRRTRIVVLAIAAALVYLLFPFSSARYEIVFDEDQIRKNKTFRNELRSQAGNLDDVPNIVVILADDLGKTDISLYVGTAVQTPNIDAIGRNGVTFTDAYCTSPICSPSRAALLTGRYHQRSGFETQPMTRYPKNRLEYLVYKYLIDTGDMIPQDIDGVPSQRDIEKQGMQPSELTLAELLQSRGYRTGIAGKWHVGYEAPLLPTDRGFEFQYGFYEAFSLYDQIDDPEIVNFRHDYFANRHIWAQERSNYCAIRRNGEVVEEDEYLTFAIAREAENFIERHRDERFFLYVPFSAPHTPFQAPQSYYDRFPEIEDDNKRVYYAMIAALDDAVGRIMRKLDELGLDENTVLWFASDNGGATYTGATSNDPLNGGKFNFFEGGINVPCAVRWTGTLPAGATMTKPVSLMDIFSTSAAVSGTPLPDSTVRDGVDLMPYILSAPEEPPHDALYWRAGHARAIRMGDWKLIVYGKSGNTFLFDLAKDKNEEHDLSAEHPEVVERLSARLKEWDRELPEPLWPRVMDYRFVINGREIFCPL